MTIPMPSLLEIAAIFFTTICIFLVGRNNIHTWWTGLIGCVLYGVLFYQSQLYADSILQVVFFATGIIGWVQWGREEDKRPSRDLTLVQVGCVLFAAGLTVCGYGFLLMTYTDAYAPFVDSAVLALSIIGQYLLMGRYTLAWPAWILVNLIAAPLFWSRGLHLSGILYAGYFIHACFAWYTWSKLSKTEAPVISQTTVEV